jgi:signal transduction histidine kinase
MTNKRKEVKKKIKHFNSYFFRFPIILILSFFFAALLTFGINMLLVLFDVPLEKIDSPLYSIFILVCCFVISLATSRLLTRNMDKFLKEEKEVLQAMGKGDFTKKITAKVREPYMKETAENINLVNEELNSISYLKKDFIRNFSHEFKTPIVSIKGYSELLLNNKDLSEEEKESYLKIIYSESVRLSNLANSTFLLSKLNTDSYVLNKEEVYLDESIEESALVLYPQIEAKQLDIEINLIHGKIMAEKELIKEIWINILNNAIKYTPEKGKITISANQIQTGYLISFSDNGIGMSENVLNHIFDEYYQGDTTHKNKGIGLGLSIAKKIIELHSWQIHVVSKENVGSVFSILIPTNS